jgi:signal recognition particle GTPase
MIGKALVAPIDIPAAAPATATGTAAAPPERQKWLDKLKAGLGKTASSISGVFSGGQIDENLYEELESALLMADTGVAATEFLLADLRRKVKDTGITHPVALKNVLIASLTDMLKPLEKQLVVGRYTPTVMMVVGVNGAGKTTSIGKLTKHLADHGASVLLAAADTFRAAAREQLTVWADRNTVEIISQAGGDPAAVSYDAVSAGKARGIDVVLVDTAGRLPSQLHLMDELRKIKRIIAKADEAAAPGRPKQGTAPSPSKAQGEPGAGGSAAHKVASVGAQFPAGSPLGKLAPSGSSAAHEVASVGAQFPAGPPQGKLAPSGGSAAHEVASVGATSAPHEVLLVIDGNTGQNALMQVKAFDDALTLTGLIVTKLDGTAKGGMLAAIARERPVPVYFIGVGEKLDELETFNAREFAQALLA